MSPGIAAPGKLFIAGEFAVLFGWPAVVMAVDRYVRLSRSTTAGTSGGLVASARAEAARAIGVVEDAGGYEADSSALRQSGSKLGLGSSAAVTVASVASVYDDAGRKIEEGATRREMWNVCKKVHDAFQQGRGSGADIAASLFGGFVAFDPLGPAGPVFAPWGPPAGTRLVFVWTGEPASTRTAIGAVVDFKARDPVGSKRLLDALGSVSHRLVRGEAGDSGAFVESIGECAGLMNEFGIRSGTQVVTPAAGKLFLLAHEFGGAAKPSGAGGGDFVLGAFRDDAAARGFSKAARDEGFRVYDLAPAPRGVHVAGSPVWKGSADG